MLQTSSQKRRHPELAGECWFICCHSPAHVVCVCIPMYDFTMCAMSFCKEKLSRNMHRQRPFHPWVLSVNKRMRSGRLGRRTLIHTELPRTLKSSSHRMLAKMTASSYVALSLRQRWASLPACVHLIYQQTKASSPRTEARP